MSHETKLEVTVICNDCGDELWINPKRTIGLDIYVEPCSRCTAEAEDKGYQKGREENE